jgi:hypothetical protein
MDAKRSLAPICAIKVPRALPHSESSYVDSVIICLPSLSQCGQLELDSHGSDVVPYTERERSLSSTKETHEPIAKFKVVNDAFTYLNGNLNDSQSIGIMHSLHPPKVCSPPHLSFNVLLSTARSNPCRGWWPWRKLYRRMSRTRRLSRSYSRGCGISKARPFLL